MHGLNLDTLKRNKVKLDKRNMDEYTTPDYNHIALITIDVQNDATLPGALMEVKGTLEVVPKIVSLLNVFRKTGRRIVHIIRLYKQDGSNVDIVRRKWIQSDVSALRPGTKGADLVDVLKPHDSSLDPELLMNGDVQALAHNEYVIYKPRWGAFYKTPLEKVLRNNGVNTLVFTGCNFPNCPRTSIYQASERDFRLIVIRDALSGLYDKGIAELINIGCEIMAAQELKDKLESI